MTEVATIPETPKITAPGIYDLPAEAYHGEPCDGPALSGSGAVQLIKECPARFRWSKDHPDEERTDALELGTIAHRIVLEGGAVTDKHIIVPPGFSMKHTNKHADLIAEIEASGKKTLRQEDADTVEAMARALRAHPWAHAAFENGKPEQSLFWRDEVFGIWCKARLDWLPSAGTIIADYKTIVDSSPETIMRTIADRGYYQKAAWTLDGLRALGVCEKPTYLFVFQAKQPPHVVTAVIPDASSLDWGRTLNEKARSLFAMCHQRGHWPGYVEDVITLGLPPWEVTKLRRMGEMGLLEIEFPPLDAAPHPEIEHHGEPA